MEEPVACEMYPVWDVREAAGVFSVAQGHTQLILLRHMGKGWKINDFSLYECCFPSLDSISLPVKRPVSGLSAQESVR